ncbi:MAG: glutamate synthase-related protein, partial [Acidimicrobiales bacterium]
LRDRVRLQVDGGLRTGRDVLVAAVLGAEEFAFSTAPLVAAGCVMMRVCHLNTCPVGVATQDPELRKRFSGRPEFVVTFFEYLAEEVREHLAALGLRSLDEAVGQVELLDTAAALEHWKASGLNLSPILASPDLPQGAPRRRTTTQDHELEGTLDVRLLEACRPALEQGSPVQVDLPVGNVDRTVGTMLGSELTRLHGGGGLPDGTIRVRLRGSAGQSLGAFLPRGITLELEGDANDYVGKGLSGGRLVLLPPRESPFEAEENVIAGNVVLYGATSGEAYLRGVVGERFCVRNSGALAVVEGVGDHGCEYMTGGRAVVLGPTGRNFGAGMSGGIAFVLDEGDLALRCNLEMVTLEALDDDDSDWLAGVLLRHLELTGSSVVVRLLAEALQADGRLPEGRSDGRSTDGRLALGGVCRSRFVKVMPKDYQRVLEVAAQAEADGIPAEEAIMAAVNG